MLTTDNFSSTTKLSFTTYANQFMNCVGCDPIANTRIKKQVSSEIIRNRKRSESLQPANLQFKSNKIINVESFLKKIAEKSSPAIQSTNNHNLNQLNLNQQAPNTTDISRMESKQLNFKDKLESKEKISTIVKYQQTNIKKSKTSTSCCIIF